MEQVISVILGAFAPHITSFLNLRFQKRSMRYLIALLICVGIGFLSTLYGKEFKWETLLANITLAFTSSQTVYNTYFKDKLGKLGFKK